MPDSARIDPAFDYRRGRRPEGRPPGLAAAVGPWFGLLGGALAWVLQFVVVYGIAEIACRSDRLDGTLFGAPLPQALAFAVTLLAAGTALAAAGIARALAPNGVRADPLEAAGEHEALGRQRFMSYAGTLMSGLFVLAILAGGLPYVYLRACTP
jgi:hypothetical protein